MPLFQRGTHFAGHVIVRLVGTGRVAEIYEVIAPDGRRRALKVFKHDAPLDAKPQARLGQEGEAVAIIEHVNVVRFFDAGVDHGRVWILLELVDGPDLRRLVDEAGGALPAERAVRIVRQACEGVAAAHQLGILHRDLSPENILVTADDLAKVADFGSAKLARHGVKTTSEQDIASSLYMAPEYMTSRVAEPRSDVYSMGLVLYEILAGAHPIAPRTATAMEICRRQLGHVPPPLAALGRDVPGDLSDLVQRVISKEPAHRGSMRDMADGLAVVLQRLHVQRRAAARSLPLPNRDLGVALTEPAMPVFGAGGTMSMAAIPASTAPSHEASSNAGHAIAAPAVAPSRLETVRDALPPPAPSGPFALAPPRPSVSTGPAGTPSTLRSPWDPAPAPAALFLATSERASSAERASTGVPVERPAPPPRGASRAWLRVLGAVIAVVALGVLGAGWLLAGRASTAPAFAPPPPTVSASPPPSSATARSSAAPTAATSASAPGRPALPPRPRRPRP